MAWQLKCAGIRMEREYRFHEKRRWRFDFADPEAMVAVEVEGVTFVGQGKNTRLGGRHVTPTGFHADAEKYAEAVAAGWRVLRVTPKMVKSGDALRYVERALGLDSPQAIPGSRRRAAGNP